MKIWNGYGSEHSANLVMIGHFKDIADAEKAQAAIEEISKYIQDTNESHEQANRFTGGMLDLLSRLNIYTFHPSEIDQFNYDVKVKGEDKRVVVTTDESDVSAFLKILLEYNAKIEVYSAHAYPDTEEGR